MSAAADVLVSNTGQTSSSSESLLFWSVAQGFTTGSETEGYTLESIGTKLTISSALSNAQLQTVSAELWSSTDADRPNSKIVDLTVPSSLATGTVTFTAPPNTLLDASTEYHLVFYISDGPASNKVRIATTSSDSEDSGAKTGWSIADGGSIQSRNVPTAGNWGGNNNSRLIVVNGSVGQVTQSTDANLSSLSASIATSSGGPFSSLNIGTFMASTLGYTAKVANDKTHLKLTPTVADTGKATVTVKGASVTDATASDAIALTVGSNAITVQVTAEDGSTTKDYTVTVERLPPALTFDPANGTTISNASKNITLTFAEAIKKDNSNTDFGGHSELAAILTLKVGTSTGANIGYVASLDSDKKIITINPSSNLADGDVYVAVSNGYFNPDGDRGIAGNATFTVDTTAPSVSISGVPATINSTTGLTVEFTFSEDVTGFDTADVTVTGGSKGTFSGSGKSYSLAVTPSGNANVVVTVRMNAASDVATNQGPGQTVTATAAWDTTPPAAPTFTPQSGAKLSNAGANIKLQFAEPIKADGSNTDFTDTTIDNIVVLKETNNSGSAIGFDATIDSEKRVVSINPTSDLSDGVVYVAVTNGYYDATGNQGSAASATFTVDTAAPTVTISGVPAAINSNTALTVGFTFSEDVTGFDTSDVMVTGGSKGTFSGSGKSYSLAVTPAGSANVVVTVAMNAATDGANQGPSTAVTATAVWDTTAPAQPTFTPQRGAKVPTADGNIMLQFNEAIKADGSNTDFTDSTIDDIVILKETDGNGTGIGFNATIDSAKQVVTIDPTSNLEDGKIYVAVTDAYYDTAGNQGSAASSTFTVDTVAPTVTISGVPATINSTSALTVAFTFSEDVSEFATGDVSVTGGSKTGFTGSGKNYSVSVTPTVNTDLVVTVAMNAATDGANRGPTAAVKATADWDSTPPAQPSFNPADGGTLTSASGNITVTFGEAIKADNSNTDFSDSTIDNIIVLKETNSSGNAITFDATIDSAKQVVTVNPSSNLSDGTVYVGVTNGYYDATGNQGTATSATFTVNTALPSVVIGGVPSKINSQSAFTATFTFSKDVTGFDTSDVTVTGASKGTLSGSAKSYSMELTPNGDVNVVVTVAQNAVTDGTNQGPAQAVSETAVWDVVAPTVAITGVPSKINSTNAFTATFTFSEDVTGFATTDVTVTNATKGTFSGSDKSYTLVVTPTGNASVAVTVARNAATDGANQGPAAAVTETAVWDSTPPAQPTFTPASGARVIDADTNITLRFAEAIKADGSNTDFTNSSIDGIITLKRTSSTGSNIGFNATINDAKRVVTINPTASLPVGTVYVGVSAGYYDDAGNQGTAASVTFTVATPNTNANLSGLTASTATSSMGTFTTLTLTPSSFSAARTAYTASVANARTHLKLTPTVADTGKATVQVGKGAALSTVVSGSASDEIALAVGANAVIVRVTAENGSTTKDYTVTITRQTAQVVASAMVSNLGQTRGSSRGFTNTSVTQDFVTGTHAAGYNLASIEVGINLSANATSADLGKLKVGLWSSQIKSSRNVPKTKIVDLEVPSSALTSGLHTLSLTVPDNTKLDASTRYHVVFHQSSAVAKLTLTTANSGNEDAGGATGWSIADAAQISFTKPPTGSATWLSGGNPVRIRVNGSMDQSTQSTNANLSGLTAGIATSSSGPFNSLNIGAFGASKTSYAATVTNDKTHLKLTPTVDDIGKATVTVDGSAVDSGTESDVIALSVGANAITVQVTAEDGSTKDYTVTVTRQAVQVVANPLVSNIGQTRASYRRVDQSISAQGFTTGPATAGYTLTSIEFDVHVQGAVDTAYLNNVKVELWSATNGSGSPSAKIADLTVPSDPMNISTGTFAFPAPANTSLTKSTKYFVIAYATNTYNPSKRLRIATTLSDAEDSGAATGWSILDDSLTKGEASDPSAVSSWDTSSWARQIRVNGATKPSTYSTNANLSGLTASVAESSGGQFESLDIGAFGASTLTYSATVSSAKTHLKLTPTVADTGKATVTVDGKMVDSGSESGEIELNVGSNEITVRVTAEDGLTSEDYTVTVTREAPALTVSFNPANGDTQTDNTADITLTFSVEIKKSNSGTDFVDGDLSSILTLNTTNASGTAIPYTATINSEKTVITLDPTSNLADGDVYVAISDLYYDGQGNQGSQESATFTVDTTGPVATFGPANSAIETDNTTNITLTFDEAIKKDNMGTDIANSDLASILTLRQTDNNGSDITYAATIDTEKTIITINPSSNLPEGPIYVAISNAYYDGHGNQGLQASATFTVDTTGPVATFDPADEDMETNNATNITLTFDEAIKKDDVGTDLGDSDLASILTLTQTDSNGSTIAYAATINSEKTIITINPSSNLPEGPIYVAISNSYYDAHGNQGMQASATFIVDTTGPVATFAPANNATETDNTTNITLTFDEALRKDSVGAALTNSDLASILTLTRTDSNGSTIAYTATINSAKKIITINPSANLPEGPIYVAISNAYYDGHGNQGLQASATFTVDTSVTAPTFAPANGEHETDNTTNITLTFSEAIKKTSGGTDFVNNDLSSLLTLKRTNADGSNIAYSATINSGKTVITLDPSANLPEGPIYVAISDAYYDGDGNQGSQASATFTVDTVAPAPSFSPADTNTVTDNTTNITLTFGEAIKKDNSETDFGNSDLASILTLRQTDDNGSDITYTATINSEKKIITINPSSNLPEGAIYVAISDVYYDTAGNQGSQASATFTVDTTGPVATFDPADDDTETNNATNITLTFDEALRKDGVGTALTNSDLASILTLTRTDSNGSTIAYAATINSAKKIITINPSANLPEGPIYVAISNAYYDGHGNQGLQASATFTVDTTGPVATFAPANNATETDNTTNITLTFDEALRKDGVGTALTNSDLASILTLTRTDSNGSTIAYTATINSAKKLITIDPTANLPEGAIYVAISNAYYDGHGNQGLQASATFTVDTSVVAPTFAPANGEHETDNTTNITLTFSEAIKKTSGGTDFVNSDLASILTLRQTDNTGSQIAYSATINAGKTVITLDPSANLPEGPVYVAISNAYYDGDGNQGSQASATFIVDTVAPAPTFSPANSETETDNTTNITLTFGEAIKKDNSETDFGNSDLASILTLRQTDNNGSDITYTATINSEKKIITINPSSNLPEGAIYVAISDVYYDTAGNQGSQASATFTVDTTGPVATFAPANDATATDNTTNITLTFDEALRNDGVGTALTNSDLASILTLTQTDSNGSTIAYAATINSAKKIITINPSSNLPEGPIYVAISNSYYDGHGNRGLQASATFTVDTTGPVATFAPANNATETDNTTNITLTFDEALRKDSVGAALTNSDLASILTLTQTDSNGSTIAYTATINSAKKIITINPSANLPEGPIYVAISNAYYDGHGNQGLQASATFTVDTSVTAPTFDPANGAHETDNTSNITLTFSEAIKKTSDGTDFANNDLSTILTLRQTDNTGTQITYSASINTGKTVITLDPSSNLPEGPIYVAISNAYYDGDGNQGQQASATFTVDTVAPAPTFSPADSETETDNTTNITLTFGEAIKKDNSETDFGNSDLASILTLRQTDNTGSTISYAATIDSEKKIITIDPSSNLPEGAIYVAISDVYYDTAGNQGSQTSATFTVDSVAPSPTFDPADGDTETDNSINITLTFGEAIKKDGSGTDLVNADLSSRLTLKRTNASGANIPYSATINSGKTKITLDPTSNLVDGNVYVAITSAYYDGAGNQGSQANATFTVDTSASSNADLSALTASSATSSVGNFNAVTLTPSSFSASQTSYTATVANGQTHLKVTPTVDDTGKATVAVRKGSSGNFSSVTDATASAAIALDVGSNTITVRVTAEDESTIKDYTLTVIRQSGTGTLATPSNVAFQPANASVVVSWSPVTDANRLVVQYCTSASWTSGTGCSSPSHKLVNSLGATSTTITGLTNSTSYRMRMRAEDTANHRSDSPYTSWTEVTPLVVPAAPTALSVTPGGIQLTLSWTAPSGTLTGYDVHYTSASIDTASDGTAVQTGGSATAANGWLAVNRGTEASPPATSQTISDLSSSTTYRVRVRAKVSAGNGTWAFGKATTLPVVNFGTDLYAVGEGETQDIEVTLSQALAAQTSVTISIKSSSSATETTDYSLSTKTLTFAAGDTSKTFTVTVVADMTTDGQEELHLELVAANNAPYGLGDTAEAEVVFYDLSLTPGLLLSLAGTGARQGSMDEGMSVTVLATLSEAAPMDGAAVTFTLGNTGTATETTDYTLSPKSVTVAEGETNNELDSVVLKALHDAVDDHGETVVINASVTVSGTTHTATMTVTLVQIAPTSLGVTPGARKLDLAWTAPAAVTAGGYDVHYTSAPTSGAGAVADDANPSGGNASSDWVAINRSGTTATQAITGLDNGTAYRVRVRTIFTGDDAGRDPSGWVLGTGTTTDSTDANLSALAASTATGETDTYNTLSIGTFAAATLSYTATVQGEQTHLKLRPTANEQHASIKVGKQGTTLANVNSGSDSAAIELSLGANAITVEVTAQDTTTEKTYTVTVTRLLAAPTSLGVTAGNGSLALAWTAPTGTVTGYDVHYTSAMKTGATPVADDAAAQTGGVSAGWVAVDRGTENDPPTASQTLSSLSNGTEYRVRVRAKNTDGNSVWAHSTGTPKSNDANLSGLTAGTATGATNTYNTLDIGTFAATTLNYTATVPGEQTHLKLTPTVNESNASVKVGKQGTTLSNVNSGSASAAISLNLGANAITVEVTAQDETTTKTYTVTVTRLLVAPTSLGVTAGDGSLALTWTAPSGTVTGYDVHYTSALKTGATPVADDAAVQTGGVSAGWVAVSRGTENDPPTASQTISSLTNNTVYRVRVRGKNSDGNGTWVLGSGTPQQTDTTGPSAPTFVPGDGTTVTDASTNITLTFTETIRKDNSNADFTGNTDLSAILTLAETNSSGTAIGYSASINTGKTVITINPTNNLADGTVYVGISNAYYDTNGNAGTAASVTFTVATPSTNADLSGLTASSATGSTNTFNALTLSPASFSAARTTYTASVANAQTHLKVTPTVADTGKATVGVRKGTSGNFSSVTDATASSAIELTVGSNTIVVRVTAEDGTTTKDYTITVTRRTASQTQSTNANLSGLTASSATGATNTFAALTLTPSFSAARRIYTASVANNQTHLKVTPTVADTGKATLGIRKGTSGSFTSATDATASTAIALDVGANVITVRVTAEDGTTTKDYTISVTRQSPPSSNADLRSLVVSTSTSAGGRYTALSIGTFSASTTSYTASVAHERSHVKLTPSVSDSGNATVTVQGTSVTSGRPSAAITLSVGTNTFTVQVTAQDGTTKDYTVTVTRRDLPTVTLSASPPTVTEGESVTITATLSEALSRTVTIPLIITDVTAEATDHGTLASIRITSGRTSGTGRIATRQDDDTNDDTFTVAMDTANLPSTVGAGATPSVTIIIDDDDTPTVELSVSPRHAIRAGESVTVTATLSAVLTNAVSIPLRLIPDAEPPTTSADYGTLASIRIAAGALTGSGSLTTVADDDTEYESFRVTIDSVNLTAAVGTGPRSSVRVRIAPRSVPIVSLSAPDEVTEGESVTVTAHLDQALSAAVSIPITATFNSGSTSSHAIKIATGATSGTLDVATEYDDDSVGDVLIVALDAVQLNWLEPRVRATGQRNVVVYVNDIPSLTTARATAREAQGATVTFTVRLSYTGVDPDTNPVTVDYTTVDATSDWQGASPATAGADYSAVAGTLTFSGPQTTKTVSVPILDDAVDEGSEHFLFRLSNPRHAYVKDGSEETHGLITNDDPLQTMWLSRFGRTVGNQVTDAVRTRLSDGLAPGAHATLSGQPSNLGRMDDGTALASTLTGLARISSMTGRERLLGSSFHVADSGERPGRGLAAWGRVAATGFDDAHTGNTGSTDLDGEVVTGIFGADMTWNRVLAGLAVSFSEGTGNFGQPGVDRGGIESELTTISPYARLQIVDRISAWGLAGWGSGDMTIVQNQRTRNVTQTDISMSLGAFGARGELMPPDADMNLALKTDALFVRTESAKVAGSAATTADASRVRLALEGGRSFTLSDSATLRPTLELGVRHDGGDAETGAGVELGGGVSYADAKLGISIDAKARTLVAHADSEHHEWGASANVLFDAGELGRGLSLSVSPTFGRAHSATERLWAVGDVRGLAPGTGFGFEAAQSLETKVGYGLGLFGDRVTGTPNVGFRTSDSGEQEWRVGWRLTSADYDNDGFATDLNVIKRESENNAGAPEYGILLQGMVRW